MRAKGERNGKEREEGKIQKQERKIKNKKKKKGRAKKGSAGRRYRNQSPSVLICDFTYSGGGERDGCRQ